MAANLYGVSGVPAGGVRVGLTAEQAAQLALAVDDAAQPWNLVDDQKASATTVWGPIDDMC